MRDVEFPCLVVCAEFSTLSEQFLYHGVIFLVPVNFSLGHEDWNVLFEAVVELFQRFLDAFIVLGKSCVLNGLGQLPQVVNVPVSDEVKFSEGLFGRGLLQNDGIDELEIVLVGHFVGELAVFGEDISGQIVVTVLAVEQEQVGEGFGEKRRVLEQEIEFFERIVGVFFNVHQGLVEQSNRVEFFFRPGWHIQEGFSGSGVVFDCVLDGGLEVKGFNEGGLFESLTVAYTLDFDVRRV